MSEEPRRTVVRLADLAIRFPGTDRLAVDSVSLEVRAGECVALVGESGSGKSLTARALLGLLPVAAHASHTGLEVSGRPAPPTGSRLWDGIRGARAGLVPQDALGALDPLRRIEHEVGDALRLHGIASGDERRRRVVAALEEAGMPEPEARLRQRSDELSGGLRQRALIASALIAGPELVVADEPTTALDADRRDRVLRALRRRVDDGAGALLITHDLASVLDVADVVHVMRDGRIVESGTPDRVLRSPEHHFTRELLAASPRGVARGTRLLVSDRPVGAPLHEERALPSVDPVARLRLEDVTVAYGSRIVLDGTELSLHGGETIGLVGPSGSGKTTLLRVALGLIAPQHGRVLVDGVDRRTADRAERRRLRRRVAFVPQDPLDSFPFGARGAAILGDALRAAGVSRRQRTARARSLADEVGLSSALLARPAAELSGGQCQRLAIARALARDPEALLLDEPVSALDVTVQARVLDLLDDLQLRRGTGYLLVSHDPDVIAHMSDRVLRLDDGRLR